jgi:hypothetical protein
MSTDFIGIFDVTVPGVEPEWLKLQFTEPTPQLATVISRYRSRWQAQTWACAAGRVDGRPELLGPGGFAFTFAPRLLEVYHLIPFREFANDPPARNELRQVWRFVAGLIGSSHAIYTHELMPYEGSTVAETEQTLRARVGPPAATFAELADAELFGPRAWYIDDFADLAH